MNGFAPGPEATYLLRVADTALVHAQRLSEWCGHAPVLEEDIALANMALDLLGQARATLTHAGAMLGPGWDEDRLAYHRDEPRFFNLTLAELPLRKPGAQGATGDFADTVLRNLLLSAWLLALWEAARGSTDAGFAAIAGKAHKEARYHVQHAADWVVRLGDGTEASAARMQAAVARAWRYTPELFAIDAVDEAAARTGLGPSRAALQAPWRRTVEPVLAEARLAVPADSPFVSAGVQGRHSEHLGLLLAEMQHLQRAHPGAVW